MERCSPVEMRKSLEVVESFKNAGIRFVAIPVLNDDDYLDKQIMAIKAFEQLVKQLEDK